MAVDVQSYLDAAPSARRDGEKAPRRGWYPQVLPIILAAHLAVFYWVTRDHLERRERAAAQPIEIELVEQAPETPIPELRKAPTAPHHSSVVASATGGLPVIRAPTSVESTTPAVTLFSADGSLRLPPEPKPQRGLAEPDVLKGRELMSRGLDCEAPDALGNGESLGESAARKYLSWIGLYNPYSAQHRAELLEERKQRCKRWLGQT